MKKQTRILSLILALLMLLSLAACGGSAERVVSDLLGQDASAIRQKDFASPQEFYRAVEQRRADELMGITLGNPYLQKNTGDNVYAQTDLNLSLDQSVLDPALLEMITNEAGMDLSWFKGLGLSLLSGRSGKLAQITGALRINDKDVIHGDYVMDQNTMNMYVAVPELNEEYFSANLLDLMRSNTGVALDAEELSKLSSGVLANPAALKDLLSRYYGLVLENIQNVELAEGSVAASGISCKCLVATVRLEGQDILNVAKGVLNAASTDTQIEELAYSLARLSGSFRGSSDDFHSEYGASIRNALDRLNETKAEDIKAKVLMTVYIDGKGEILGRRVEIQSDEETSYILSLLTARDGDKLGLEGEINYHSSYSYSFGDNSYSWENQTVVTLKGTGSYSSSGKLSGDFLLSMSMLSDYNGDRDFNSYDLFTVKADGTICREGFLGEILLTPCSSLLDRIAEELEDAPAELMNLIRSLSISIVNKSGTSRLDWRMTLRSGDKDLLSVTMTQNPVNAFDIKVPASSVQLNEWKRSIGIASLNTIMNNLRDAGVPASLLNGLNF